MAIFGILSDTHDIDENTIRYIVREFAQRKVRAIIHCGDIEKQHLSAELFGNLPVWCALNKEQLGKEEFKTPPPNWEFTAPDDRVRDIDHVRCYVGHRLSFDLLAESEASFEAKLAVLRKKYDGLRWVFAGHMHHQTLVKTLLVTFINPGAVQDSPDGYEFATTDTETGQVVFSRVPKTKYLESPFTVGIISDTLDISKRDADFWKKLAQEFKDRDVSSIVHCANIAKYDIGLEALKDFQVYYRLRPDQGNPKAPENWHPIPSNPPIVTINERQFYVHPSLARTILEKSEADMHRECLLISESQPEVSFILFGNAEAYLSEDIKGRIRIMNPGDALSSRSFATVCFPRCEITFGKVPFDPLPPIE